MRHMQVLFVALCLSAGTQLASAHGHGNHRHGHHSHSSSSSTDEGCLDRDFNVFVARHTNRYAPGLNYEFQDAVLTPTGFAHAMQIEEVFTSENITVDAIFANLGYQFQVAYEFAANQDIPVYAYRQELNFPTFGGENDLNERIDRMDDCPDNILIMSHGGLLLQVLHQFDYAGEVTPELPEEIDRSFGFIYGLEVRPGQGNTFTTRTFGDTSFLANALLTEVCGEVDETV